MATASKLVSLAQAEIGTVETGTNNVKYNTEYYGGQVSGSEFDWCVVFIWWLFQKANAANLFCGGKKTAYVPYVYNYATQHNLSQKTGKIGDLAIISFSGGSADHIGIVESVSGNTYTTIEGNTSGSKGQGVYRKTRKASEILAFYRPAYEKETNSSNSNNSKEVICKVEMKQIAFGSTGAQVKTLQRIMYCYFGCPSALKIDGIFGTITKKYCIKLQAALGITQDGICGVDTWTGALNLG